MTSIVYPGQGSQYLGMSKDFYQNFDSAKKLFQSVEDYTKINITDIIFENKSNLLDITQYTQLAIFCSSLSIFTVLKEEIDLNKLNLKFMLGHSLGEYSALASSNVLSVKDCANLLKMRGELMHNAYEANQSGMAAIIGKDCLSIENIIAMKNLPFQIANDNSPPFAFANSNTG